MYWDWILIILAAIPIVGVSVGLVWVMFTNRVARRDILTAGAVLWFVWGCVYLGTKLAQKLMDGLM